jgi:hypothetical protein
MSSVWEFNCHTLCVTLGFIHDLNISKKTVLSKLNLLPHPGGKVRSLGAKLKVAEKLSLQSVMLRLWTVEKESFGNFIEYEVDTNSSYVCYYLTCFHPCSDDQMHKTASDGKFCVPPSPQEFMQ